MYVQLDVVIARKFIAWEIALGKLADPFAYAAFLIENKQAHEAVTRGDLQDDATKDVGHQETGNGTLCLAFTVIGSLHMKAILNFKFFRAVANYWYEINHCIKETIKSVCTSVPMHLLVTIAFTNCFSTPAIPLLQGCCSRHCNKFSTPELCFTLSNSSCLISHYDIQIGSHMQNPCAEMLYAFIFSPAEGTRVKKNPPELASSNDSKKKLLILDLNGVLLGSAFTRMTRNRDFNFRPHCCEFLQVCLSYFEVAVWSSKLRYPPTYI